jgi:hypothetical protein
LILEKFPRQIGFLLGLVGLILFTWGFAYTKPNPLWLFAAWIVYPFLGFLFYFTNLKLSLIFGLIFLLYPPLYIASYNSVSSLKLEIVSVQRVFETSPSLTVTLTIDFAVSAPLASLPVTIGDMTLQLLVKNSSTPQSYPYYSAGVSIVKGGTIFPYGHLDYQSKFTSSDSRVVVAANDTRTPVELANGIDSLSYEQGFLFYPVSASSLIYSHGVYLIDDACWDWGTGSNDQSLNAITCDARLYRGL